MKNLISNKIIGIIGAGNMGEAILAQAIKNKAKYKRLKRKNFIIVEKDKLREAYVKSIYNVKIASDVKERYRERIFIFI